MFNDGSGNGLPTGLAKDIDSSGPRPLAASSQGLSAQSVVSFLLFVLGQAPLRGADAAGLVGHDPITCEPGEFGTNFAGLGAQVFPRCPC